MTTLNVSGNSHGFTLVELMVVTAIVGLLAAVSVPQFAKLVAKSRQSEAKANLASVYAAEKSFHAEYSGYATNLQAVGFSPAGHLLYNIGFHIPCATWATCAPNFEVVAGAVFPSNANETTDIICGLYGTPMTAQGCKMRMNAIVGGSIGWRNPRGIVPSPVAFSVGAAAQIYEGSPISDLWSIDQNKTMVQNQSGIP